MNEPMNYDYYARAKQLETINTDPTKTDQAAANETDINVIVSRIAVTGQYPARAEAPLYGDWTQLPVGLRDTIETARSLNSHRAKLPDGLKELTPEQLLTLTPEQAKAILTPPETNKPKEQT